MTGMATAAARLLIGIRKALTVIYSRTAGNGVTIIGGTFADAQAALQQALNLSAGPARDAAVRAAMATLTTITEQRIILEKALPLAVTAVENEKLAAAGYVVGSPLSRFTALQIIDGLEAGKTYEEVAYLLGLDLNTGRFLTLAQRDALVLLIDGSTEAHTIPSLVEWAAASAAVTTVTTMGNAAAADLTTVEVVTNGLGVLRDAMRSFFNLVILGDIGPSAGMQIDAWVRQLYDQTTLQALPSVRLPTGRGSRSTGELDPQMINKEPTLLLRVSCETSSAGTLKFRNALGGLVVLSIGPGLGPKGVIYNRSFPNGMMVEQTSTADRYLIQWQSIPTIAPLASVSGSSTTVNTSALPDSQDINARVPV
jgi:hypothetical protein